MKQMLILAMFGLIFVFCFHLSVKSRKTLQSWHVCVIELRKQNSFFREIDFNILQALSNGSKINLQMNVNIYYIFFY